MMNIIKPKKIEVTPILNIIPDIPVISPKSINIEDVNVLEKSELIEDIEKLKKKLNQLGIRFNTDPKLYQKRDYWLLICILYRALIHLYEIDVRALMVKEWLNPHSDKYIPTEKLVAETIEELDRKLDQEVLDRIQAVADEAALRLQNDLDLSDSLDREVIRLEGLISAEELARQLADTNLQNTKLDNLTAGANISITNNVISAVDTIYDDTEVRGLIDQVDSKVDSLDDFECGTIVPTTTNFVEGTDYTIHEALQRTANLFEGYQGYIDDINELIPNQTTPQNQLADKAFVNSTVATNAANFRGNWNNYTSVPTDINDYPEDYSGNKTPTNNDYLVVLDGTDYGAAYTGMWRFIYIGDWSTSGKIGWQPLYRVGSAFTQAQQDAIDSGVTSTKVGTYDGYAATINALLTDKLDKVYTADKVYGTNNQGSQIGYTAGDGISFTNGLIVNTRTSAAWGNITGTLSNQTDLQNTLNNKADNATTLAGYGITDAKIQNGTITLGNNTITPLTLHLDISGKEDKSNKVTSISSSSTNTLYPSAKCVYDEFTTTVTSDNVSSVGDVTVYTNLNIQVIDKTQDSSSTFAIDPNKMYMFGTKTSLTITLNAGEEGIVNEYMFLFTSGSVATTLNVPNTVVWLKDPDIQTGKKYAVSIENNLGIIGEWSNE